MSETERGKNKHFRTIFHLVQSCLICILIILVAFMMTQISRLQGTARVINYAGLVRGATQRLVKLEIAEIPNDKLVYYLDEILRDLKYGEGQYKLVSLDNEDYQNKLDSLMLYWESLKEQMQEVRIRHYEGAYVTDLVEMSEVYFVMADETVSAAEVYSEKIASRIRATEFVSAIDMCLLLGIIVAQSISAMRMHKKNMMLAQKAYIDTHTGLQNKNRCEELLNNTEIITEPTACLMFDINNLKLTNDTLGHLAGDQLISDFAKVLKSVVPEGDFAGRCGGDEFMVILYKVEEHAAFDILRIFHNAIEHFNETQREIPISYADGWAISTDFENCTLRTLFNEADHSMYVNKQKMKAER